MFTWFHYCAGICTCINFSFTIWTMKRFYPSILCKLYLVWLKPSGSVEYYNYLRELSRESIFRAISSGGLDGQWWAITRKILLLLVRYTSQYIQVEKNTERKNNFVVPFKCFCLINNQTWRYIFIQLSAKQTAHLVNKHYENEVTLTGQTHP